jgi:hypothetical protein
MTAVTWLFPISCALRTARSGGFSDTRNGRRRLADEGEDHTGTDRSTTAGKPTIVEPQTFGTSVHLLAPASAGVQTTCAYPPVHRRHPSYRSQVGEVRVAATTESSPMVGSSSTATSQRWRTVNDRCTSADRTDLAWLRVPQNVQRRLRLEASQNTGSGQKSAALSSSI